MGPNCEMSEADISSAWINSRNTFNLQANVFERRQLPSTQSGHDHPSDDQTKSGDNEYNVRDLINDSGLATA